MPSRRALILTLTRCASGDIDTDERRVLQLVVQGLGVLLGVVGFFQPDTPSGRAYTGEHGVDGVDGIDGVDGVDEELDLDLDLDARVCTNVGTCR